MLREGLTLISYLVVGVEGVFILEEQ